MLIQLPLHLSEHIFLQNSAPYSVKNKYIQCNKLFQIKLDCVHWTPNAPASIPCEKKSGQLMQILVLYKMFPINNI